MWGAETLNEDINKFEELASVISSGALKSTYFTMQCYET